MNNLNFLDKKKKGTRTIYRRELIKFEKLFTSLYGAHPTAAERCKIEQYLAKCYPELIGQISVFKVHVAAVRNWHTHTFPGEKILSAPRVKRETVHTISVEQVRMILEASGFHPCGLIFRLIYESGLRVKEIVKIKACDLNFEKMTIQIRNSGDQIIREAEIPIQLKYKLLQLCNGKSSGEYIFSLRSDKNNSGKPISKRTVHQFFGRITEKLNIQNASIQTLRDSYAVHMISRGYDRELIMEKMGLKSRRSMERYYRCIKNSGPVALKSPLS